ncbi:hypothetical protein B9T19_03795 [Ignatzschineria sp. F8392]|uniref:carboxypeptidase-like regulatory domain-containing protein n=1 Tax=Ignatzschineria sp. F8392 TaxID=1980117 RepID=UPI000B985AB9|nr:carboxypeptidase-like regulatory domain-containing protein [Ignatzschineria sp. F8392]OYQ81795.1 hypothetical protein B9T19_03795 [Ignatzschineria sp. F8392]
MLQTGTLYSPFKGENSVEKEPIANVYIYFSKSGKPILTVKTNNAGKFSFNLPVGSYQVSISQGVGFRVFDLAGGAPFELTKDSKQNAFESWVLNPVYLRPEENPLVVLMRNIAQKANESAEKAKDSANEANTTVKKFKGDTVGRGKLVRESNVKYQYLSAIGKYLNGKSEPIKLESGSFGLGIGEKMLNIESPSKALKEAFVNYEVYENYSGSGSHLFAIFKGYRSPEFGWAQSNDGGESWSKVARGWSSYNTTIDSNGHLKAASPIVRLFDDRIEHNDQFKEEPQFRKIDTGIYQIFNTLGLAKEGWTVEIPKDKHGKPYFHVIVQKTYDGVIISVHDEYDVRRKKKIKDIFGEEQEVEVVGKILGEARDIKPHERWIDLRFHEEVEDLEEQVELEKHLE